VAPSAASLRAPGEMRHGHDGVLPRPRDPQAEVLTLYGAYTMPGGPRPRCTALERGSMGAAQASLTAISCPLEACCAFIRIPSSRHSSEGPHAPHHRISTRGKSSHPPHTPQPRSYAAYPPERGLPGRCASSRPPARRGGARAGARVRTPVSPEREASSLGSDAAIGRAPHSRRRTVQRTVRMPPAGPRAPPQTPGRDSGPRHAPCAAPASTPNSQLTPAPLPCPLRRRAPAGSPARSCPTTWMAPWLATLALTPSAW
jgi:hypothetical protein